MQHTLMILNPGHFHAALVLRERHPALSRDVYVYAPEGPELTQFLKIAGSFNQRAERPTDWVFHLRTGSDGVERALDEGKADAVLAASIFHFGTYTVAQAKAYLQSHGLPVRN